MPNTGGAHEISLRYSFSLAGSVQREEKNFPPMPCFNIDFINNPEFRNGFKL